MQARFRTYIIFEFRYFLFQKVGADFIVFDHTGNLYFLYSIGYWEELGCKKNTKTTFSPGENGALRLASTYGTSPLLCVI